MKRVLMCVIFCFVLCGCQKKEQPSIEVAPVQQVVAPTPVEEKTEEPQKREYPEYVNAENALKFEQLMTDIFKESR